MFSEPALNELQELLSELDQMLKRSSSEIAVHAEGALDGWRERLRNAQEHFSKLQEQAQRTAKTANQAVQENPWRSVAVAAAAGLLVGLVMTSGARSESH